MAEEKQIGLSKATLDRLRLEHPRNRYVVGDADEWAAFLIPPPIAAVKAFQHSAADPAMKAEAQSDIFLHMVPPGACWTEWDGECDLPALLSRFPLASGGAGDAIMSLLGLSATQRGKR